MAFRIGSLYPVPMHLFGRDSGPHLRHFRAKCLDDQAELTWEVRGGTDVHWRVLRSESGYAEGVDAFAGDTQTAVMEGLDTYIVDRVEEGKTYYYTVFAQDEHHAWHRQVRVKLKSRDDVSWRHGRSGAKGPSPTGGDLLFEAFDGQPNEHAQVLGASNPLRS